MFRIGNIKNLLHIRRAWLISSQKYRHVIKMARIKNPIIDSMHEDKTARPKPCASIQLVHPEDVRKLSLSCEACVCAFLLKGCSSCKAFTPTWIKACESSQNPSIVKVHVECTPDNKSKALDIMRPGRDTFPCVCVFVGKHHSAINYAGEMKSISLSRLLLEIGLTHSKLDSSGDDESPLNMLRMFEDEGEEDGEDEEGVEDEEEGEENEDDEDQHEEGEEEDEEKRDGEDGARGPSPRHVGITVTSDVSPQDVVRKAADATQDMRVCVLYYTDWCGHCKNFKPVFNQCVTKSNASPIADNIHWCAVNCEEESGRAVAAQQGVKGYPTLKVHHKYAEDYRGPRTVKDIWRFVTRKTHLL